MPRPLFQTKLKHARFVVGPFSSESMATLGGILGDDIGSRIGRGLNVNDIPALPLSAVYAKTKARKGRNPVRDWIMSGRTLAALKCLTANENKAVIGFNNPVAGRIAHWNNLRERAFGVSSLNRTVIRAAVKAMQRQVKVVTVRNKVA